MGYHLGPNSWIDRIASTCFDSELSLGPALFGPRILLASVSGRMTCMERNEWFTLNLFWYRVWWGSAGRPVARSERRWKAGWCRTCSEGSALPRPSAASRRSPGYFGPRPLEWRSSLECTGCLWRLRGSAAPLPLQHCFVHRLQEKKILYWLKTNPKTLERLVFPDDHTF